MKLTAGKRQEADLFLVPVWEGGELVHRNKELAKNDALALGDFKGKLAETFLVYDEGPEDRVLLVGLGKKDELTKASLAKAYGAGVQRSRKLGAKSVSALLPKKWAPMAAEALLLANELRHEMRHDKEPLPLIEAFHFVGSTPAELKAIKETAKLVEAVHLARELALNSSETVTPEYLGKVARRIAKEHDKVKATVFSKERIEKEKMGLILAVNKSSPRDPAFIILEYKGDAGSKEHTVICGKGITFDTGGLSLKPSDAMLYMRGDMAAGAASLATIQAVAALKLKVNVTAVVPSTENCIGGASFRPGDVYTSYSGKTVHVGNTDAEGRLVLADAITYACRKLKPTRLIDLATLTGACVVALGEEVAAVFSDDELLAKGLLKASETSGDALWRMPLVKSYNKMLESELADIKNIGTRWGGAITAGLFLQAFVEGDIPWAHLDIAGPAYLSKETPLAPHRVTGFGVRLLVDLLRQ